MQLAQVDLAAVISAALSAMALILVAVINTRTRQTSARLGQTNHGSGSMGSSLDALRDNVNELKGSLADAKTQLHAIRADLGRVSGRVDDNRKAEDAAIQQIRQQVEASTERARRGDAGC